MSVFWNTDNIFNDFRRLLQKDLATRHFCPFLFNEPNASEFRAVLEEGALDDSPQDGMEKILFWFFQKKEEQEHFPAKFLWDLLLPLLENAISPKPQEQTPSPENKENRTNRPTNPYEFVLESDGSLYALPASSEKSQQEHSHHQRSNGSFEVKEASLFEFSVDDAPSAYGYQFPGGKASFDELPQEPLPPTPGLTIEQDFLSNLGSLGWETPEQQKAKLGDQNPLFFDFVDDFDLEFLQQESTNLPSVAPKLFDASEKSEPEEPEPLVPPTPEDNEKALEDGLAAIMGLLHYSPLCMWIDVNQTAIYLQNELPNQIYNGVLDLTPLWNHLNHNPGVSPSAVQTFLLELGRQNLPWELQMPSATNIAQSQQELPTVSSKKPKKKPRFQYADPFEEYDTPPPRTTLRKTPPPKSFHDSREWFIDLETASSLDNMEESEVESQKDPIEEGSAAIMGLLYCSPLCMWVDLNQIAIFLKNELPNNINDNTLDLQPFAHYLINTQGADQNIVMAFFEEVMRQKLPWKLKEPSPPNPNKTKVYPHRSGDAYGTPPSQEQPEYSSRPRNATPPPSMTTMQHTSRTVYGSPQATPPPPTSSPGLQRSVSTGISSGILRSSETDSLEGLFEEASWLYKEDEKQRQQKRRTDRYKPRRGPASTPHASYVPTRLPRRREADTEEIPPRVRPGSRGSQGPNSRPRSKRLAHLIPKKTD